MVNSRCLCMRPMLGEQRPRAQITYVAFSPPWCEHRHQGVLSGLPRVGRPLRRPTNPDGRSKMGKTHLVVAAALVAAATLAPPALARPATDVTYGGKTTAKWPVMVQLSRDSRQVA